MLMSRFISSRIASVSVLIATLAPLAATSQVEGPETWDTATLYQRACAACHGVDGRGLSPEHPNYQSFNPPPADFTDPLFNSREPAADWVLVIKYGGSKIGLSKQMPAYGQALSDRKIEELVAYLKNLTDASRYPPGDLNFRRPIATIKAFPEDEGLIINRFARGKEDNPDSLRTTLYYARRFGARYQGEIKLSHLNPDDRASELEELELGFKWAVHDNLRKMVLYTLGIEAAVPIEDSEASNEIIPYFSLAKGLSSTVTFQGMLKAKVPVDDTGDGEATLSGILHWMPSIWPRSVSPALELTVTEPFDSAKDTGATAIPQLYFGLSKLGHVALALGVEVPITDLEYDYRIHTFLLWDIADGPFWRSW
jgi:mono/diheme cytochrome c family protein